MDRKFYTDRARDIMQALRHEVNGSIRYEVYPEIDSIIFKVRFKGFDFNYAVNCIDHIHEGDSNKIVSDILHAYRNTIYGAFFKTEERKERDRKEAGYVD